jgi:hypothetical protein
MELKLIGYVAMGYDDNTAAIALPANTPAAVNHDRCIPGNLDRDREELSFIDWSEQNVAVSDGADGMATFWYAYRLIL